MDRRTFLIGSGALLLAGCTSAVPAPTASPTGSIKAQLDEVIKVISGGSEKVGVAIKDLRSDLSYTWNGDYASQSASMAKPMLVAMALRKSRPAGLSSQLQAAASAAITQSDNDAADLLWDYGGKSAGYDELAKELSLPNTHSDPGRDWWSWTWTTPADQLLFLTALFSQNPSVLTAAECSYITTLMGQVRDDQTWGVGAPKSSEVSVQLKNGWVEFQSTDKLWAVNSIGHVSGDKRDYLLTIMSRVPNFDTGKALCSEIGKWVFEILG